MRLVYIMLLLWGFSCTKVNAPVTVPEKMLDVMTDLHFAEAAIAKQPMKMRDSFTQVYYEQIYQIHEVTKDSMDLYFKQLEKNPKLAEALYEKLLEDVKKKTAKLEEKRRSGNKKKKVKLSEK